MKNKYRYSLIIITFLLLITTSMGSSYSLWTVNRSTEVGNVLEGLTCFEIDTTGSTVSLRDNNLIPMPDERGVLMTPSIIKVENHCNIRIPFRILLVTANIHDDPINEAFMRFSMSGDKTITPAYLSSLSTIDNYVIDGVDVNNAYVITTDYIEPNESKSYGFRTWLTDIDLNQTTQQDGTVVYGLDLMNKYFDALIITEANSTLY